MTGRRLALHGVLIAFIGRTGHRVGQRVGHRVGHRVGQQRVRPYPQAARRRNRGSGFVPPSRRCKVRKKGVRRRFTRAHARPSLCSSRLLSAMACTRITTAHDPWKAPPRVIKATQTRPSTFEKKIFFSSFFLSPELFVWAEGKMAKDAIGRRRRNGTKKRRDVIGRRSKCAGAERLRASRTRTPRVERE